MMPLPKVVIGAQWGDEGKGKIVDYLASQADQVVRFNGGNNAGHTVVLHNVRYPLSLLPSGILWKKQLLIAQGVVINPRILLNEIEFFTKLKAKPNLAVDFRANIVMPYHQWLDQATEESKGEKKVGSLKLGIGYCYEDRNNRHGIRLEDLVNAEIFKEKLTEEYHLKKKRLEGVYGFKVPQTLEQIFTEYVTYGKKLKVYMSDVSKIISGSLKTKRVLFEGAHGTFLDGNFGTYPFTTAVNTISGSVFSYVGFPPQKLEVIGIVKAYTTRVGGGPFPSELFDSTGNHLQEKGGEIGTVSKRKRRCGWLDLPMLKLSHRLNGFTRLAVTKLDVLTGLPNVRVVTDYMIKGKKIMDFPSTLSDLKAVRPVFRDFTGWHEDLSQIKKYGDLPKNARIYLSFLAKSLKVPVTYISVAAERNALIINKA